MESPPRERSDIGFLREGADTRMQFFPGGVDAYINKFFPLRDWVVPWTAPKRIICAGDSTTEGGWVHLPIGSQEYGLSYPGLLQCYLDGGAVTYNAGISGETSTQILARFNRDVIAYHPDLCVIMVGRNDGLIDWTGRTSMQNIIQMVCLCVKNGIIPFLCTITPATRANVAAATRDIASYHTQTVNTFIKLLCLQYGIPGYDVWAACADPSSGDYLAGLSDDGIHPNKLGIQAFVPGLAAAIAAPHTAFMEFFPYAADNATVFNPTDWTNLVHNGALMYDADANSVADGVGAVVAEATSSFVTGDANIRHQWQKYVFNSTISPRNIMSVNLANLLVWDGGATNYLTMHATTNTWIQTNGLTFISSPIGRILEINDSPGFIPGEYFVLGYGGAIAILDRQCGTAGSAGTASGILGLGGQIRAGDWLLLSMRAKNVNADSVVQSLNVQLAYNGPGTRSRPMNGFTFQANRNGGHRVLFPFQVPAGTTSISLTTFVSALNTSEFQFAEVYVCNLSRYGFNNGLML